MSADMWIADSGTDRVYKYTAAASRNSGSQAAAANFVLTTGNTNAQGIAVAGRPSAVATYEVEWVRQLGSAGDDVGRGVAADNLGNVFFSGWTTGSLAAPNPTAENSPFLARYDSDGNVDWVHQEDPGSEGVRVATDDLGNVFAPRLGSMNKYNAAGTLLWTTPIPSDQGIYGVTVDALGNAYGATESVASSGYDRIILRKFDGQTGSIVWEQTLITGASTNSSGISADGLGNIYVVGHTGGSAIAPNAGPQDVFIAKYTEAGDFVWAQQFGTAGSEQAFNVAADVLGNVYVGGATTGSLSVPNAGGQDLFLAKYNASGNQQWIRQWGTSGEDSGGSLRADGLGNVFVTGQTAGALGGPHLGGKDIVMAKYDADGNRLWISQFGTSGDDVNAGGMSGDDFGNVYIAGRSTGSWGGPNAGGMDAVLIKLSPPGDISASASAIESFSSTAALATAASRTPRWWNH